MNVATTDLFKYVTWMYIIANHVILLNFLCYVKSKILFCMTWTHAYTKHEIYYNNTNKWWKYYYASVLLLYAMQIQFTFNIRDRICEKGSFTYIQFTNFDNS